MSVGSYDKRLEGIIKKYGYEAEGITDSTRIHDAVIGIFTEKCTGKKVAIWGVGKKNTVNSHAAVIIHKYILNLQGLVCLVDSNRDIQGTEFLGYPVIAPEELPGTGVEVVIAGSRASAKAIIKDIKNTAPWCVCIDIYAELASRGITVDYNFFSEQNMYTRLYQLREKYASAGRDGKAAVLRELVASYLHIRDFHYAEKYAAVYIENRYEGYEGLMGMMEETRKLQEEVAKANAEREGDVLVHLVDSLRAMDVFRDVDGKLEYGMFSSYQGNSISFTNAYSTGPTTYESMMGVVKQELSFEEDVYDGNFMFTFEDFPLLGEMEAMGKKVVFYVAGDYYIMEPSGRLERKEHLHMSEKLWCVACDMAESSQAVFGFLYYPWELHFPLLCGYMGQPPVIMHFSDVGVEDMPDTVEAQFEDCRRYVDTQFSYYKGMLGGHTAHVFMGDHSQPVYNREHPEYPYYMYYNDPDRSVHVAFFISWDRLEGTVYDRLVSMADFNSIMGQVFCKGGTAFPAREEVRYQYYGIQNKKLREAAGKNGFWDYTEGIQCFLSGRYLFAATATGKEEVYEKEGSCYKYTESQEGKAFAVEMKEKYGTGFPGFWTVRYGRV
jgi:hypothetical protein